MIDKELEANLLRRLFEGEKIKESVLDEIGNNIYQRGFRVLVSDEIEDIKVVYVHPYFFRFLKVKGEDLSQMRIRRGDKPEILLNNMIVKEGPSLPSYDYIVLHREDVKSLYPTANIEGKSLNFNAKLVFGKGSKVFKDLLPKSGYMEREEIDTYTLKRRIERRILESKMFVDDLIHEEPISPIGRYINATSEEEARKIVKGIEKAYENLRLALELIKTYSNQLTTFQKEKYKEEIWELVSNIDFNSMAIRNDPLPDLETVKWFDDIGEDEMKRPFLLGWNDRYEEDRFIGGKRKEYKIGVKIGKEKIDLGYLRFTTDERYRSEELKPYGVGLSRKIGERLGLIEKTGIPVFFYEESIEEDFERAFKTKKEVPSKRMKVEEKEISPKKLEAKPKVKEIPKAPAKVAPTKVEAPKPTKAVKPTKRARKRIERRPKVETKEAKKPAIFRVEGKFNGTFRGTISPN